MKCNSCKFKDEVWICLICGNIGCGRYKSGHAIDHYYLNPQHALAMQLDTERIWYYIGDTFVHRILNSKEL